MKNILAITVLIIITGFKPVKTDFNITIERKSSTNECSMGYLSINDEIICYSLELPWKDNLNNISCVPEGSYKGLLRYDKADGWRIQLDDVPNRTGVQIHMGNYTSQIKGCILVGANANTDNCSVGNSTIAYSKLKEKFYGTTTPISTPSHNIIVTFK